MRTCPNCGIDFEYFRKNGRLGCDRCYEYFNKDLIPLIQKIHNSVTHVGKSPSMEADESNKILHLSKLRSSLAEAIENEDYEKAAILRDKIKEIEEKEDH